VHGAILGSDFGLQSVLFHAVLVIMVLLMAVRNFQHTSRTSNVGVLSTILFLIVIFTILHSYTSGSSNVAINVYWQSGLIAAIAGSLAATTDCKASPPTTDARSRHFYRPKELIPS